MCWKISPVPITRALVVDRSLLVSSTVACPSPTPTTPTLTSELQGNSRLYPAGLGCGGRMAGLSLTIVSQIMENTEIRQYDPSLTITRIAERDRSHLFFSMSN